MSDGFKTKKQLIAEVEALHGELVRKDGELEEAYAQLAARTRDAEVDAALERLRARALGMRRSEDLAGMVSVLFREQDHLHKV